MSPGALLVSEGFPRSAPRQRAAGTPIGLIVIVALLATTLIGMLGYIFLTGGNGGDGRTGTSATVAGATMAGAPTRSTEPPAAAPPAALAGATPTGSPPTTSPPAAAPPLPSPQVLVAEVAVTATNIPSDTPAPTATEMASATAAPTDIMQPATAAPAIVAPTPAPTTTLPAAAVATAAPTKTSPTAAVATAAPKKTSGPGNTPAATVAPVTPGVLMNFENFTGCKRGDQPYGTLEKSAEQAHSGSFSGKLSYSFPTVKDNYVVFLCGAKISGQPPSLSVWVRGDGGDHFLNAWVRDSQNEVRSFTFGRVPNTGQWVELTAPLDTAAGWPAGHISGPDNGKLDLPISLYALVLDGVPDGGGPFQGVLYLDDLATSDAVARSQPAASTNPGRTGGAAPTTPAAAAVSTVAPQPPSRPPLTGHITYTCNEGGVLGVCALDVATKNTWRVHAYAHQGRIRGDGRVLMDGVGGGKDNLLNVALDGSHDIVMSAHPEDTYPDWSPSGVSAVFHSTQQGDRKDRIYIQGDTSAMQEPSLMHAGAADLFGQYPTWLDNWRIAFTGCDYWASGSNCGIYTTDSKGDGIPARVTDNPADRSSDGRGGTLLFSSPRNGNWEVYAIPYGGGNPQNLTNNPSHDFGAAFSPSRGQIAFMSNRGGWSIWVMNADGSGATQLISVPGGFGANWAEERLSWGP